MRVNVVQYGDMALKHAVLDVVPGEEQRFEEAFCPAISIISAMGG